MTRRRVLRLAAYTGLMAFDVAMWWWFIRSVIH